MSKFKRVVGCVADVKELEYICALHQTCDNHAFRANGTISSCDVQRLLVSRGYARSGNSSNKKKEKDRSDGPQLQGINHEQAVDIVRSLGGGISQASMHQLVREKKRKNRLFHAVMSKNKNASKKNRTEVDPLSSSSPDVEIGAEPKNKITPSPLTTIKDIDQRPIQKGKTYDLPSIGEIITSVGNVLVEEHTEKKSRTPEVMSDLYDTSMENPALLELEEYLDMVQVLSILFIPTLVHAAANLSAGNGRHCGDDNRYQSLEPQPANLLEQAVQIFLKNVFMDGMSSENAPILDEDFVEALLLDMGESERAQDLLLIREMVDLGVDPAAASQSRRPFDVHALAQVLTADVVPFWPLNNTDRCTTYWEDVMGVRGSGDREIGSTNHQGIDQNDESANEVIADPATPMVDQNDESANEVITDPATPMVNEIIPAAISGNATRTSMEQSHLSKHPEHPQLTPIDYVVDSHTSIVIVCIIWTFYVMCSITYAALFQSTVDTNCEENAGTLDVSIGCQLASALWTWMIFAIILSIFGFVVVLPLSWGNSPYHRTPFRMIASVVLAFVYAVYVIYEMEDCSFVLPYLLTFTL
jgi:hypothetical protein